MDSASGRWRILLPLSLLLLAMLACGGFQVRVTPTAGPEPEAGAASDILDSASAATVEPVETPEPTPSPSPSPEQAQATSSNELAVGGSARVTVAGGIRVREQPTTSAQQVGKLDLDAVVRILEGPAQADSYNWWRIDTGGGLTGWVAAGPENDPWLRPEGQPEGQPAAEPAEQPAERLVDRPVRLGDLVQVTVEEGKVLTVREGAGTGATPLARVLSGTRFTVRGGPEQRDGMTWWQLEGEQVSGWAAEGDGADRWLTAIEQ